MPYFTNKTPEGRKAISRACRLTIIHGYVVGDLIIHNTAPPNSEPGGVITDWGSWYDKVESIPDDWEKYVPYREYWNSNIINLINPYSCRKAKIKESPNFIACSKKACKERRCAGPDWCKCPCNHPPTISIKYGGDFEELPF